jgi:hypothetical protein
VASKGVTESTEADLKKVNVKGAETVVGLTRRAIFTLLLDPAPIYHCGTVQATVFKE